VLVGGEVVVSDGDLGVLSREGVRSFHAAIILRTDVKGERGDVCGRRREETVGVTLVEFDTVLDAVKVFEKVLAKPLGLNWVPLRVTVVGPLVGGESKDDMDRDSDIEDDADDTVEPALLFAGEVGREP
jgi:hypothetical protein